jgi:hypothetical protein
MASIRAGRDESKGQTDIHGLTINLPKTVLKALVPAGVSEEMLTKLAGAAVDVVSLPGKSALSSFTGGEDSGVGMMGEFAATMNAMLHGTTGTGEQDMDSGWKAASRTAVMTVKTYEHLATMERMVREMKDKVLDSFDQSMRQILEPLGWTEAVTNYFLHNGRYPNLVRASYSLYESFFTELLRLYQSYNSFEPVKKVLDHYSEQFRLNRWTAISRFGLILSNYITLREGFTDKFRPAKVERVLNDYFRQTLLLKGGSGKKAAAPSTATTTPTADSDTKKGCPRCGTSLHAGGAARCPTGDAAVNRASAKHIGGAASAAVQGRRQDFSGAVAKLIVAHKEGVANGTINPANGRNL